MLHLGPLPDVIGGERLQVAIAQQIDATVTDMREVIHAAAQYQRGERGGHADEVGTRARLRLHPAIERAVNLVE